MGPISPSPLSDHMLRALPSVDVLLSVGELYSLKQMPTWWRLTHCGRIILLERDADSVASNAKSSFGKYCSYLHIWHTFSDGSFFLPFDSWCTCVNKWCLIGKLYRDPNPRHDFTKQWISYSWPHCGDTSRSLITSFRGPTWGPSGADRTQAGPMLAPWTLLPGFLCEGKYIHRAIFLVVVLQAVPCNTEPPHH